jgi:hypothetical protein
MTPLPRSAVRGALAGIERDRLTGTLLVLVE